MKEFLDYDEKYPELVYDVLDYFRIDNPIKEISKKSVLDYCIHSRFNASDRKELIQPSIVYRICERFVQNQKMSCWKYASQMDGSDANYAFFARDKEFFSKKDPAFLFWANCLAYGFPYIYQQYLEKVLPIVVRKGDDSFMGTCFRLYDGIVTAKHCIEADEVSILGYSAEFLSGCPVLVSSNTDIDLAFIRTRETCELLTGKASVLDQVLVMGYPSIPRFFEFCAVEQAIVSAIPTRGSIASLADQYLSRDVGKLMLITARIRGGNSGGPVINSTGAVVGVAFCEPMSEGNYDEMGYGIAYPIDVLKKLLDDFVPISVKFKDFEA